MNLPTGLPAWQGFETTSHLIEGQSVLPLCQHRLNTDCWYVALLTSVFSLPSDRCRILTHIFKFKPQSRHHRYLRPSLKRWQQCPADGRGGDLPSGHHTCLQLRHVRILLKSTIFFCKMQFEKNENKRKRNRDFLKENKSTGTVKCLFYWNPFCHLFERLCTAWSS